MRRSDNGSNEDVQVSGVTVKEWQERSVVLRPQKALGNMEYYCCPFTVVHVVAKLRWSYAATWAGLESQIKRCRCLNIGHLWPEFGCVGPGLDWYTVVISLPNWGSMRDRVRPRRYRHR